MINSGHILKMQTKLTKIAKTYVWWKKPTETLQNRDYFLAHVMNLGTWDDAMIVLEYYGKDAFITALRNDSPGVLNPRSWTFCHHWFDL